MGSLSIYEKHQSLKISCYCPFNFRYPASYELKNKERRELVTYLCTVGTVGTYLPNGLKLAESYFDFPYNL